MWTKVNKTIALDPAMLAKMETRMKADGISMAELVRQAIEGHLNNGEQPDSIDNEQPKSISDMLANSDFAVK